MGVAFQNGPNYGHDVFVPLDFIIGGKEMAGEGWRMLMESLAVGRGISLPSLSVGAAELCTRLVGAYATVREQFDTPIGRFEGIEEPLARIGGLTYLMNAARKLILGAIDQGEKPSVHLGDRQGLFDREHADRRERRHGHPGRRSYQPRSSKHPRADLQVGTHRHHRGRGQYLDSVDDHLRAGRHPLPSVRSRGNASHRRRRSG